MVNFNFYIYVFNTDTYLSNKTKTFLKEYYKDNPFVEQLAQYAVNGKCLKICKIENLPPKLRNPDPVLIASFRSREPYSYLHYSYYQVSIIIMIVVNTSSMLTCIVFAKGF